MTRDHAASKHRVLTELLLQLFSVDQLRLLIHSLPDGDVVARNVFWQNASAQIASDLVMELQRRRMIDELFLETLTRQRPRAQAEIDAVAVAWGLRPPNGEKTPPIQQPPPTAVYTTAGLPRIQDIFPTSGTPAINYVEPDQLAGLLVQLGFTGQALLIEGASGIGKTTLVKYALADHLGVERDMLRTHTQVTWLSSKNPQERQHLQQLIDGGAGEMSGFLVIDDFHRLEAAQQEAVAGLVKDIADRDERRSQVVLIGVNPVGDTLTRSFPDVTGRFRVINISRQPEHKILELIQKGEEAANITFQERTRIARAARGSFYTAQMLCQELAILEGVIKRQPQPRQLTTDLSVVIEEVQNQLRLKYHSWLVEFASHDERPPPRGATLALLWSLTTSARDEVSLQQARARYPYPHVQAGIDWLLESNLGRLFASRPRLAQLFYYNAEAGILSLEDPQLDFYLNNLRWPAFARDSGHSGVSWQESGPRWDGEEPRSPPSLPPQPPTVSQPPSRLLHLSDLHIENTEQALLLYDQLRQDLQRNLGVEKFDVVVVSGDIVNRGTSAEYQSAAHFFRDLKQGFRLHPQQLLLVPGNHDMDWNISKSAYAPMRREEWSGRESDLWHQERGAYVEVADEDRLRQRFLHFANFHEDTCNEAFPLEHQRQVTIRHYPASNLLLLGLNSSWSIDHLHTGRAGINALALARALNRIDQEPAYRDALRLAVWHHPISSAEEDRIRDTGFLERLAVSGFRFGLHGHIHSAQQALFRYDMAPSGRRIDILGAGTSGAPMRAWRPGYPLQYQLLEFTSGALIVHTRRRESPTGAWQPDARWTAAAGADPLPRYTIPL